MSTATRVFPRTGEQRLEALRRANEIRVERAKLKRSLTGPAHAARIILDPPAYAERMKVVALLEAVPKYGKVKAARKMNVCRISYGKTIGGLSPRQREELARELRS